MMRKKQWNDLRKILTRNGPFVQSGFNENQIGIDVLKNARILIVGAGGLGCEMLKDLAMMGFQDIHIIDCDTIEISNLNRQFLFRNKDLGRSKAEVAAEFINNRIRECNVTAHFCRIEEKSSDFYSQFNIVLSGLDSISPRRWLNSMLFNLLEPSNDSEEMCNIIPMVDGGTEGFKGNLRVIIPSYNNPCIECTLDLYPPQITYPLCTLTQRPRLPEHCIEYVKLVQWSRDKPFGEIELDCDDPVHLQWIYERALDRANEYGIEGVTYRLTQGVVKHIIPAVASTNATIAAACVTEVFKLMTASAPLLNNYLVLNNSDGIYTYTYSAEKQKNCPVCGCLTQTILISKNTKLSELIELLQRDYQLSTKFSLTTIMSDGLSSTLYMSCLHEQTEKNLSQTLQELNIINKQHILVADNLDEDRSGANRIKRFVLEFT
ncbi:TP53-regulating kinase-like [Sarcoptes scabiei]|nr:TP53-regulating kinase-like [Sarcoptes scabiei]